MPSLARSRPQPSPPHLPLSSEPATLTRCVLSAALLMSMTGCATLTADPVVDVIIDSVPRDAEVFMGKRRLGVTPLMVQMASKGTADEKRSFLISKTGYRSSTITLSTEQNAMLFGNVLFLTTTSGAPSATTDFSTGYAYMFSQKAFVTELRPEVVQRREVETQPKIKRLAQQEREEQEKKRREEEAREAQRKALRDADAARRRAEEKAERARLEAKRAADALERERLERAAAAEGELRERARAEEEVRARVEREAREREVKERAEREARERAEREAKERAEREVRERAEREAKERAEEERARLRGEQEALEAELERVRASREVLERAREELRLERERFEEERRLIEEERARQSRSRGWRLRPLPLPRSPEGAGGPGVKGGAQVGDPEGGPEGGPEGDPEGGPEARERRLLDQMKARQRSLEALEERERDRGVVRPIDDLPAFEVAPLKGEGEGEGEREGEGEGEREGEREGEGEQGALPPILSPSWGALALSIEGFSALTRALAEGDGALVRAIYLRMIYAREGAPEWDSYKRFMGCVSERRALLASASDGLALYRALEALAFEPGVCQASATARAPYAPRDPSSLK